MVQNGSKHQRLICAHTGTSTFIPYVLPIPGTHVCSPKKIGSLNTLHGGISIPPCMYNSYHYHFLGAPKKKVMDLGCDLYRCADDCK